MSKNIIYDGSYDRREAISLAQKFRSRLQGAGVLPSAALFTTAVKPADSAEPRKTIASATVEGVNEPNDLLLQVPDATFSDDNKFREEVWNTLLQWAQDLTHSFWSFVADEKGLVIADYGEDANLEKDEVVSNITSGLQNLSRFGEPEDTHVISFQKGETWTSVARCHLEPDSFVLVGLLSKKEVPFNVIRHIQAGFVEKLKNL